MSPSASHGANDLLLSHSCGLNKLNVICVSPEVAMPIQYELRRLFHLMNIQFYDFRCIFEQVITLLKRKFFKNKNFLWSTAKVKVSVYPRNL